MTVDEIKNKLSEEGYTNIYEYTAEPGEVDEEHTHDYDVKLVILEGRINITAPVNGVITNMSYQKGSHVSIEKGTPHTAKVCPQGCRYIVAEKI